MRGTIDAGDYKQFIFPLLFFKRLSDVYDEEYAAALAESGGDSTYASFAENHRFQIPDGAHWSDVRQTSQRTSAAALQTAMRADRDGQPRLLDGIFGDAPWTNKERLPDETLKNLIEHFSTIRSPRQRARGRAGQRLRVPDQEVRRRLRPHRRRVLHEPHLVHLMTRCSRLSPASRSTTPPAAPAACCSRRLTNCGARARSTATLKLYGQERNLMTSSIARMNLFLHGIEDFRSSVATRWPSPSFIEGDRLRSSMWCWPTRRTPSSSGTAMRGSTTHGAATSSARRRRAAPTMPSGSTSFASLDAEDGRCAILFPHGVLFRDEEARDAVQQDRSQRTSSKAVIGLGPNLFYNSPMEACVVVCRKRKPPSAKGKVLFIDAVRRGHPRARAELP